MLAVFDAVRHADTSFAYAANGCGAVVRVRRPNQQPAGPERTMAYDSTYRFVTTETSEAPDAQTAPLVKYYGGRGKLKSIDGMADIAEVTRQIEGLLKGV